MKTFLATIAMMFAQDWNGARLGISVGSGSGEVGVPLVSGTDTLDSGTGYGLFAGYNLQRNNLI